MLAFWIANNQQIIAIFYHSDFMASKQSKFFKGEMHSKLTIHSIIQKEVLAD
jgi:hypothetical protein